ncbi:MAG: murein hydrolase activator EnvC family protein [Actinomycetota bacterium]
MLFLPASAPPQIYYVPPVNGAVIRHFEPPPNQYSAGHRGLDLAANIGTTVVASVSGHVAFAGKIANEWYVSIDDADGIRTTYDYLASVLVKKGQDVLQKQPVGRSGKGHPNSSEAPHMMFGMKRGSDYLDPEPYLVAGFRHDYSSYVRLSEAPSNNTNRGPVPSPVPLPSNLSSSIWTQPALLPRANLQRRSQAQTRSSFAFEEDASKGSPGISRVPLDGPRARSPSNPH